MVKDIVALAPDTAIDAAARLLTQNGISAAPVVDENGRPLGVVSHTDLLDSDRPRSGTEGRRFYYRIWGGEVRAMGVLWNQPSPEAGVASDVMSPRLLTIAGSATVDEAARQMLGRHIHRLFVVEQGRIVGLITALDCLRALVGAEAPTASLRDVQ